VASGPEPRIDRPGLPGPFGALMDEYAKAAAEFCAVLDGFAGARYASARPRNDEDTRTPRALSAHVVGAARRYADYVRKRRGLPFVERALVDPATLPDPAAVRRGLGEALRYTEGALDGFYDVPEAEILATTFAVRWGPQYDPEMILEHAIVHLLRHRRQLERWDRSV
jgi:hypothetical protein